MTKASDVRGFFEEGRKLVEQDLDIAEQFKALRDAARVKNVDWSQIKALLKAQILDERDGTDKRVRAIVEKADCASAYADMLGLGSEKNNTREEIARPRQLLCWRTIRSLFPLTAPFRNSLSASQHPQPRTETRLPWRGG